MSPVCPPIFFHEIYPTTNKVKVIKIIIYNPKILLSDKIISVIKHPIIKDLLLETLHQNLNHSSLQEANKIE